MSAEGVSPGEERVLVLAPTASDAAVSRSVLNESGMTCRICAHMADLCRSFEAGAGAILLTEEALADGGADILVATLWQQPAWSDVPVILLTDRGADSPAAIWAMDLLNNVAVLERPVRMITLVSTLRTALKARRRQYELRNQTEALREADRRKDEFLATLAHELRNPLAAMRTSVEVLKRRGPSDPALERSRSVIDRQLRHMARLLDDLLDVSRITQNKLELRRERVALADVVWAAVETSRPLIDRNEHHLTVTLPPDAVSLDADPVRLAQVFSNMLNNAARYTERGGDIWLTATREGGEVVVAVKDSGIGISGDMLPRVFDLFSQAGPALQRSHTGLGIGLSLVKGLVEMHGGTVEAHSDGAGQGAEFIVRLPTACDEAPVEPDQAAPPIGAPTPTARRVLVADDIEDNADTVALLLQEMGHEVRVAYGGQAAVTTAADFRPDVVLLDIGMPGVNGLDAARMIRAQPWGEGVRLIAVTGWASAEDRRRTRDAGFDHHLVKPVDVAVLAELLR
ncbi:MAG: ATP-binding protein [Anaerolineae bacterium]